MLATTARGGGAGVVRFPAGLGFRHEGVLLITRAPTEFYREFGFFSENWWVFRSWSILRLMMTQATWGLLLSIAAGNGPIPCCVSREMARPQGVLDGPSHHQPHIPER